MQRFEAEPRARKPAEFDAWLHELGLLSDLEGLQALIGITWYAPPECLAYLVTCPGVWPELLSRGRYADWIRFAQGVVLGRQGARG